MNKEELNHQSKVLKGTQSKPKAEVAAITKKFEKHAKVAATTEEIEKHAKTDPMIHRLGLGLGLALALALGLGLSELA